MTALLARPGAEIVRLGHLDALERGRLESEIALHEHRRFVESGERALETARARQVFLEQELTQLREERDRLATNCRRLSGDIESLLRWASELEQLTKALYATRRWRTGDRIARTWRHATLRRVEVPASVEYLERVFQRIRGWRGGQVPRHLGDSSEPGTPRRGGSCPVGVRRAARGADSRRCGLRSRRVGPRAGLPGVCHPVWRPRQPDPDR